MVAPVRNIWQPRCRVDPAPLNPDPSAISRNGERIWSDSFPANPDLDRKPVLSQLVDNPSFNLVL
jgi:hypothetical protein